MYVRIKYIQISDKVKQQLSNVGKSNHNVIAIIISVNNLNLASVTSKYNFIYIEVTVIQV